MVTYVTGQEVDVIVLTKRGKEPEWVPGVIHYTDDKSVTVKFESGGTTQRFALPTGNRIRLRGEEVKGWVFSI